MKKVASVDDDLVVYLETCVEVQRRERGSEVDRCMNSQTVPQTAQPDTAVPVCSHIC